MANIKTNLNIRKIDGGKYELTSHDLRLLEDWLSNNGFSFKTPRTVVQRGKYGNYNRYVVRLYCNEKALHDGTITKEGALRLRKLYRQKLDERYEVVMRKLNDIIGDNEMIEFQKQLSISKRLNAGRCAAGGWKHVEDEVYTHDVEIQDMRLEVKFDIGKTIRTGNLFIEFIDLDIVDGYEVPRHRNEQYDFLNYVVMDGNENLQWQYLIPVDVVSELKAAGATGAFPEREYNSYNAAGGKCKSKGYLVPCSAVEKYKFISDKDIYFFLH